MELQIQGGVSINALAFMTITPMNGYSVSSGSYSTSAVKLTPFNHYRFDIAVDNAGSLYIVPYTYTSSNSFTAITLYAMRSGNSMGFGFLILNPNTSAKTLPNPTTITMYGLVYTS